MKVSKRDLILLIAVLFIGVSYVLAMFVFKPIINKIDDAQQTLEQTQARRDKYLATVGNLENLATQQNTANDEAMAAAQQFLPEAAYDNVIWFFNTLAQSEDISIDAVSFSGPEIKQTLTAGLEDGSISAALDNIGNTVRENLGRGEPLSVSEYLPMYGAADTALTCLTVTVEVADVSYDKAMGVIRYIEQYGRKIYPESVTFSLNAKTTAGRVDATIDYSFYYVVKPDVTDAGMQQVQPGANYGTDNPFR